MATRRMIEREIVELDDFVDMPTSTRLLYVYLNLNADDEGFLGSPKRVMRAFGGGDDDMKILIAKGFLISFESGVMVITHWHEHNTIRQDRMKPTRHQEEKCTLQLVEKQWVQPSGNQVATKRQPMVAECPPSISVSNSNSNSINTVRENAFDKFWELYNLKKNKIKTKKLFMALNETDFEEMRLRVKSYVESTNTDGTYPTRMHPTTYLNPNTKVWRDEITEPQTASNSAKQQPAVNSWGKFGGSNE